MAGSAAVAPTVLASQFLGPGDVLVDVRAAGVNPLDVMIRNGEFKQVLNYPRPFTLGHDVSGTVTELGADVGGF
ncbi:alcohol dehydrogenase catalytic domain-containing protein [Nocardioides houyundeii]|uniref:alcohol dehydrogenase catalytic domain-containing protein n=1 Tax=Nocardioides houyundeii TaxID=2045452 RepID=UPI0018EFB964|nr:alcohol dehydrogenase catalytic domain-containing protein [Nocardioides houyundeii]